MVGKRVKVIRMEDPYTTLKKGDRGTVEGEDMLGHILVKWDNGSEVSLMPEIDEYVIESNYSKVIKFNEFKNSQGGTIDFIDAKMEELSDLVMGYGNAYFEWSLDSKNESNILEIRMSLDEDKIISEVEWVLDLESLIIESTTSINGDVETDSKECINIDESLDYIEKEIHHWLSVSESYVEN